MQYPTYLKCFKETDNTVNRANNTLLCCTFINLRVGVLVYSSLQKLMQIFIILFLKYFLQITVLSNGVPITDSLSRSKITFVEHFEVYKSDNLNHDSMSR